MISEDQTLSTHALLQEVACFLKDRVLQEACNFLHIPFHNILTVKDVDKGIEKICFTVAIPGLNSWYSGNFTGACAL